MLGLIQEMSTAAQIMDLAHRRLYQIARREEQHGPTTTEICRGVSALCGAPNWLAAESVSGTLSWMPFATLVRQADSLAHTSVPHHRNTLVVIRRKALTCNFRDLFCEVTRGFQVVAEEPHFAVNVALQQHLPLFIRELTMNRNGGGPANRCDVTLKFTAFLEAYNLGVKNNETEASVAFRSPSR